MIKYAIINDVEELEYNNDLNYDFYSKYFFHGTRAGILNAPNKELRDFFDACDLVMAFSQEIIGQIDENELDKYGIKTIINGTHSLFLNSTVRQYKKSSDYEYGDFYVTTGLFRAITYANNGAGELGENAYHNAIGIKDFGIPIPDKKINDAIEKVITLYEKYQNSKGIVLAVKNVRYEDLKSREGASFKTTEFNIVDLYECFETDQDRMTKDYRLGNIDKYDFFAIPQSLFKNALKKFTGIKDIEKFFLNQRMVGNAIKFDI